MPVLVEGIRKDFPEVATLELGHEGDREGLKRNQRCQSVGKCSIFQKNVNDYVTAELGHLKAGEEVGKTAQRSDLASEITSFVHETRKLLIPERIEDFPDSPFSILWAKK